MIKSIFILLLTFQTISTFAQDVVLHGDVGGYDIEMTLRSSDSITGDIEGHYHYKGKKNQLTLIGQNYDGNYFLQEQYKEDTTGYFYLEQFDDTLRGKWVNDPKWFEVELVVVSSDLSSLYPKPISEYTENTNSSYTGGYVNEFYFINQMWFEEDRPNIEIGFNGGHVIIDQISEDSIQYSAQVVCGPTYHFAFASGIAVRNGNDFTHQLDEECLITLTFSEKAVYIDASASFECGFGARANLSHSFSKVTDHTDFSDDPTIDDLKGITD